MFAARERGRCRWGAPLRLHHGPRSVRTRGRKPAAGPVPLRSHSSVVPAPPSDLRGPRDPCPGCCAQLSGVGVAGGEGNWGEPGPGGRRAAWRSCGHSHPRRHPRTCTKTSVLPLAAGPVTSTIWPGRSGLGHMPSNRARPVCRGSRRTLENRAAALSSGASQRCHCSSSPGWLMAHAWSPALHAGVPCSSGESGCACRAGGAGPGVTACMSRATSVRGMEGCHRSPVDVMAPEAAAKTPRHSCRGRDNAGS